MSARKVKDSQIIAPTLLATCMALVIASAMYQSIAGFIVFIFGCFIFLNWMVNASNTKKYHYEI